MINHFSLYEIFPVMAPSNETELERIQMFLPDVEPGEGRTAGSQVSVYTILNSCRVKI